MVKPIKPTTVEIKTKLDTSSTACAANARRVETLRNRRDK